MKRSQFNMEKSHFEYYNIENMYYSWYLLENIYHFIRSCTRISMLTYFKCFEDFRLIEYTILIL